MENKQAEEKLKDFEKLVEDKKTESEKSTFLQGLGDRSNLPWHQQDWPIETIARKSLLTAIIIMVVGFIVVALLVAIFNWKY